ncbi:transglycosylase-like protein with SLT domain [Actinomycetospora succinea]|uniref:Transglycosylase-like protein with SLT domain n=1 Tax=Actinomycetospora succinea TaxID=663603 RepID=A0A4V3DAC7_9PSEU|nr:transglycosylase SLT domain-containing protein [Actinomycetospora succinea]TDQ61278.1 transglycosylase-like protein with SLT domain [Actinomycetospora succinea]
MSRHGVGDPDTVPFSLSGTPTTRRATRSSSRTGSILVAAVAAGAVLPAIQTLDTHVADAEAPTGPDPATASLALAAQHQAAPARPALGGVASVSPISMPATAATARTASTSGSDDEPSAGDENDVTSLIKSMSVTRENGPLKFGTPYEAGNERTLDGQIAKALGLMGLPQRLAPGVKKIIMRESTGRANAVNDWDSNASAGTPSKGLMQLIDTTFRNAVLPELADRGIFDPVANITAGVRTMIANHSIDDVEAGGLRNSSGNYIGYGGAAIPDDGLGRAD